MTKGESRVRSWDRHASSAEIEDTMRGRLASPGTTHSKGQFYDTPVRVVAWPEGAPDQKDVPQAGEVRVWHTTGDKYIVVTGIPFLLSTHTWALRCKAVVNKAVHNIPTGDLKPIPEPEPKLYTEDEILDAVTEAEKQYSSSLVGGFSDYLLKNLKK